MDQKFFLRPFAQAGDKTAIPDGIQAGGTVSFEQGFGFDYQRELGVDPLAKAVPRQELNYALNAITDNVGAWQRYLFPEFITAANNGGSAFPYARGTIVRYRATGGDPFVHYQSRVDNNTALPTVAANWAPLVFEVASTAEANAGASDAVIMTPAKVASYVATLGLAPVDATETVKGRVELATQAETDTGTDDTRAVTPLKMTTRINSLVPAATTAVVGKTRLATNAETTAGALATVAVTPAGAKVELDKKAALASANVFLANQRITLNNASWEAMSPNGSKGYRFSFAGSDAVDSGGMLMRWDGAAWDVIATITATGFAVTGVCTASGGFGPTSSRHLKDFEDVEFPYSLETFEQFEVRVGTYKPQFNRDGRRRLFLVAENVADVMPEAELKDLAEIDGIMYPGIDHSVLVPAMAKALADASRMIRDLRERVAKLEG
jgi:hypothetical protein